MTFSIRFNLLLGFVIGNNILPYSFVLSKSSSSEQSPAAAHTKEDVKKRIEDLDKDQEDISDDVNKDLKEKSEAEASGDKKKAEEYAESAAQGQEESDSISAERG